MLVRELIDLLLRQSQNKLVVVYVVGSGQEGLEVLGVIDPTENSQVFIQVE